MTILMRGEVITAPAESVTLISAVISPTSASILVVSINPTAPFSATPLLNMVAPLGVFAYRVTVYPSKGNGDPADIKVTDSSRDSVSSRLVYTVS